MSKTKQKRLTAYFLLLLMCAMPACADPVAPVPSEPATPNENGSYIYVDENTEQTTYDIVNVSGYQGTQQGAVVNHYSGKSVTLNSVGGETDPAGVTKYIQQYQGNVAQNDAGGALFNGTINQAQSLTVDGNARFLSNTAQVGGAVFNEGTLNFLNGTTFFQGNSAIETTGESRIGGGAIANYDGIVNFNGQSVFEGNTSANNGGAILNWYAGSTEVTPNPYTASININNDIAFNGNRANAQGGAIANYGENAYINVAENAKLSFNNNVAVGGGGAVYNGGVANLGDEASFTNNSTSGGGGAILNEASLEIGKASSFDTNWAAFGGAIYNTGETVVKGGTNFTNNTASVQGGAIYNSGKVIFDTTDGKINFSGNTAAGSGNDMHLTSGSSTVITGGKELVAGDGIIMEGASGEKAAADLDVTNGSRLTLEGNSVIDGNIDVLDGSKLALSTTVTGTGSINSYDGSTVHVHGWTHGPSWTNNNSTAEVSGTYEGDYTQHGDDAKLIIQSTGHFNPNGQLVDGGSVVIQGHGELQGVLTVTDAVNLELDNPANVIDGTGLQVAGGHIVAAENSSITLNPDDYTVVDGNLGTSVTVTDSSINSDNGSDIVIGNGETLTLSNNATSEHGFVVNGADTTLKLAPTEDGELTLKGSNTVKGNGNILVDGITGHGVGTVNISGNNAPFSGTYTQKDGTVNYSSGQFYGGVNNIEGGTLNIDSGVVMGAKELNISGGEVNFDNGTILSLANTALVTGGTLNMGKDMILGTDIIAKTDASKGTYGTVNVSSGIGNTVDADKIGNGHDAHLVYSNPYGSEKHDIYVQDGAGLGLLSGTAIVGDLTLQSDKGVRDLTIGNGSSIDADNITLGTDTYLTLLDKAGLKSNSAISMGTDTRLTFGNDAVDATYDVSISSDNNTALLYKTGSAETNITSSLGGFKGSIDVDDGTLNLTDTTEMYVNNVTVTNASFSNAASMQLEGDLNITNSTFEDAGSVFLRNGTANIVAGSDAHMRDLYGQLVNVKNSKLTTDKSAQSAGDFNIENSTVITGKDLLTETSGSLKLYNSQVTAGNSAKVGNKLSVIDSTFKAGGMVVVKDAEVVNSTMTVDNAGEFLEGSLNILNSSNVSFGDDLTVAKDIKVLNNSKLEVGKNVSANTFEANKSSALISGDLTTVGDIKLDKSSLDKVQNVVSTEGAFTADNESTAKIAQNLTVAKDIKVLNNSKLEVGNNIATKGGLIATNSEVGLLGDLTAAKDIIFTNSTLYVEKNAKTDGAFTLTDSSNGYVGNDLTVAKDLNVLNNSTLIVGNDAKTEGAFTVSDNSNAGIEGYLTAAKDVSVLNNSTLTVGKDAKTDGAFTVSDNSLASVADNLTVEKDINVLNDSKLLVGNTATTNGGFYEKDSHAEIGDDLITANDIKLDNSTLIVGRSTKTDGAFDAKDSTATIGKDLTSDKLALDNSIVTVGGNLKTGTPASILDSTLTVLGYSDFGKTTISGNSNVNLGQDSSFDSLSILDNATFTTPADVTVKTDLVLGNEGDGTPTINLLSGDINSITTDSLILNGDTNIKIDVDPNSGLIDSIKANTVTASNGAQLIVTDVNFLELPTNQNSSFDLTQVLVGSGVDPSMIHVTSNTSITKYTEIGKFLFSTTPGSNIASARLVELNPQMYRGQVATVSSYANQLIVNNMLLNHAGILANDLMARDKYANTYSAATPALAPYQYTKKDGSIWLKGYGSFEKLSLSRGLHVGNNAYGSILGADFPAVDLGNGWNIVPTGYVAYNGGHQHFNGVSMYQNGGQLGAMATAYKGDFISSLLTYVGGYYNDMSVSNKTFGNGSDGTGNWFAGVASKSAYNIHLPGDFIFQPTGLISYNIFGSQNYHSNFGNLSMNSGYLNGLNIAPGVNLIWNKETFSLYGTAQLVFNLLGDVSGKVGNINLDDVKLRSAYVEYGLGATKAFSDVFNSYLQFTIRNGYRTGIGFQGGMQWKVGKGSSK